MSQVRGSIALGKGQQRMTIELKGKLTPQQWAEFQEKLQALVKGYNAEFELTHAKKKKAKTKVKTKTKTKAKKKAKKK